MENVKVCQAALNILLDKSTPLIDKFRAVFTLRNVGGGASIDGIFSCIWSERSELLKHECAYCLGQMKDPYAIKGLIKILKDENQEIIVRHEAAEALAAIGIENEEVIRILQTYMGHSCKELQETCYLALKRFAWLRHLPPTNGDLNGDENKHASYGYDGSVISYDTIDPTPCLNYLGGVELSLNEAEKILLNEGADLYERYQALFTLRDIGSDRACHIMGRVLSNSDEDESGGSACSLLKHEVAFVLGQMQNPVPLVALESRLTDAHEHPMVRHECAEAIGSIVGALGSKHDSDNGKGVDVEHYQNLLKQYLNDPVAIVRESCAVALDIADYVSDDRQFQFVPDRSI